MRPQAPATSADWLLAAERADPDGAAAHGAELAGALVEAGRLDEALAVVDAAARGTARATRCASPWPARPWSGCSAGTTPRGAGWSTPWPARPPTARRRPA